MVTPVPPPYEDKDWARMLVINAQTRLGWTKNREVAAWMAQLRPDGTSGIAPPTQTVKAQLTSVRQRVEESVSPSLSNLKRLLAEGRTFETSWHAAYANTRELHVTKTRT